MDFFRSFVLFETKFLKDSIGMHEIWKTFQNSVYLVVLPTDTPPPPDLPNSHALLP